MQPLYEDSAFTFRFADDRIIPRFHLEGVPAGKQVAVFKIDPGSGHRLGLLATATVGEGGWVNLGEPIIVRAGEAFVAVVVPPVLIRPETGADHESIRQVNRLAFGQEGEARLVDALREGGFVRLSLVAEENGQFIGHILFSDLSIVAGELAIPALALAPMAVLPGRQHQGIGSALVRHGLKTCGENGQRIVIVLGHPRFYQRFGFSAERARRLESPYSGEAFMAVELVPGALDGVSGNVIYPPPFRCL